EEIRGVVIRDEDAVALLRGRHVGRARSNLGFSRATLAQSSGNENTCRAGSNGPPARRHGWVPGGEAIIFSVVRSACLPADLENVRNQILHLDVALLERPSGDASDDQQLAGDVAARENRARVGLGVAERPGLREERRERPSPVEGVEEKGERSGKYADERDQGVARVLEAPQRRECWETCSDGRGIAVVCTGRLRRRLERIPVGQRTPEGELVGADHMQSSREPAPVMRGHLLRGGRIDDDAYVGG